MHPTSSSLRGRNASPLLKALSLIAMLALAVAGAIVQGVGHRAPSVVSEERSPLQLAGIAQPADSPKAIKPSARNPHPAKSIDGKSSTPATDASEVRIGTWNIEWLGKPEERSGSAKGIAQSVDDMADYIIDSGVAALAVEEIVTGERGEPIRSRELEAVIDTIRARTGRTWQYVLFPGRAEGDQLTGVLWNSGVLKAQTIEGKPFNTLKDKPYRLPIERGRSAQGSALWNRPPHAMKFSTGEGKSDFVLVVLHMKADYNGDFAAHRAEEAAALVRSLPAVRRAFDDQDIVLLGDTNCVRDREPAIEKFTSAAFIDLNSDRKQTHWRGGTMDRVLIPNDQPEFSDHRFVVDSEPFLKRRNMTPADFKRTLSDHYLVWTSVKIIDDDD